MALYVLVRKAQHLLFLRKYTDCFVNIIGNTYPFVFCLLASCSDGDVRLIVDANTHFNEDETAIGRVEVCFEGRFGTVCDDFWDNSDASVFCKELGFSPYGNYHRVVPSVYTTDSVIHI